MARPGWERGRAAPAVALLGALALVSAGCTSAPSATQGPAASRPATVRASAHDGGLGLHVTATTRARAVRLVVRAADGSARGALGTVVAYGDGTTARTAQPQVCLATPEPRRRTWHLSHRYAHPGTYVVRVRVRATCSPASAAVRLRVTAG